MPHMREKKVPPQKAHVTFKASDIDRLRTRLNEQLRLQNTCLQFAPEGLVQSAVALGLHWRAVQEIDLVATVSVSCSAASRHELQGVVPVLRGTRAGSSNRLQHGGLGVRGAVTINIASDTNLATFAARRAFALNPQMSSQSSKDCPRTSVLDHTLSASDPRLAIAVAQKHVSNIQCARLGKESNCVTAPTQIASLPVSCSTCSRCVHCGNKSTSSASNRAASAMHASCTRLACAKDATCFGKGQLLA